MDETSDAEIVSGELIDEREDVLPLSSGEHETSMETAEETMDTDTSGDPTFQGRMVEFLEDQIEESTDPYVPAPRRGPEQRSYSLSEPRLQNIVAKRTPLASQESVPTKMFFNSMKEIWVTKLMI